MWCCGGSKKEEEGDDSSSPTTQKAAAAPSSSREGARVNNPAFADDGEADAAAAVDANDSSSPTTEEELEAVTAEETENRAQLDRNYTQTMDQKNATVAPNSWRGDDLPADVDQGEPFAGSADSKKALGLAGTHGVLYPLLGARQVVLTGLRRAQLTVCEAAGDARTSRDPKVRPPDHPCWGNAAYPPPPGEGNWTSANAPSKPGYALNHKVMLAVAALKENRGLATLDTLVTQLTAAVFATIPGKLGKKALPTINSKPVQALGLDAAPLAGKTNGRPIPMAEWTPAMRRELESAAATLKSGAFGEPADFGKNGRVDFFRIASSAADKVTYPNNYLIALGINRHAAFHANGQAVADAVPGAAYSAGPVKHRDRITAKCLPGADYYSDDAADKPNCKRVLDVLRGSVMCTSHGMMDEVSAKAAEVFGQEPAVRKDRRQKVQHDMLLIFQVDGMFVELQLHYVQTMCIKSLLHAVFEIQRLATDRGTVTSSGLKTVMYVPAGFDNGKLAKDVKLLVHL